MADLLLDFKVFFVGVAFDSFEDKSGTFSLVFLGKDLVERGDFFAAKCSGGVCHVLTIFKSIRNEKTDDRNTIPRAYISRWLNFTTGQRKSRNQALMNSHLLFFNCQGSQMDNIAQSKESRNKQMTSRIQ